MDLFAAPNRVSTTIPMMKNTIMIETTLVMSVWSRSVDTRTPSDGWFAMIRNVGSEAGRNRCRCSESRRVSDRRRPGHHDHEQDRLGRGPEQDDREREPDERRHDLEAGDQRPDCRPQRRDPGDQHAYDDADQQRQRIANHRPLQGRPDRVPEQPSLGLVPQVAQRDTGAGEDKLLPAGEVDQLPDDPHKCRRYDASGPGHPQRGRAVRGPGHGLGCSAATAR
jgi:hypothetical protein